MNVALIDYGAGNLHSVRKALSHSGFEVIVCTNPQEASTYSVMVLPGQGHFGQVMGAFKHSGFESVVREHIAAQKPFLGICVGLQLLMESSEEAPDIAGLGVLKGQTKRFPCGNDSVPQMGWNQLSLRDNPPLLAGLKDGDFVYFANSYYVDFEATLPGAHTNYAGISFKSAVSAGALNATQFHPEKSQQVGLRILKNFKALAQGIINKGVMNKGT